MNVFHVVAGLSLLGVSAYAAFVRFTAEVPEDRWKILTVFAGLLLAMVLFTGFIQLGSRHSVHNYIIYKLVATAGGGVALLFGLVSELKGFSSYRVAELCLALSVICFILSLFLGIAV